MAALHSARSPLAGKADAVAPHHESAPTRAHSGSADGVSVQPLSVTARWRSHTELPLEPTSALISIFDPDIGVYLMPQLYEFRAPHMGWESVVDGSRLTARAFFWMAEHEVAPDHLLTAVTESQE